MQPQFAWYLYVFPNSELITPNYVVDKDVRAFYNM
jgi:hypothetical protein